jgi:DUF1365 family protein
VSRRSALYRGFVSHRRVSRPDHGFRYALYMCLLDLGELEDLDRSLRLFGHRRRRALSFHESDHLDGRALPLRESLEALFARERVSWPGGRVELLTHCRVLGYVFNPISLFYCYDPAGALGAVVAEVNNTFGDRHPYLLPVEEGRCVWRRKKLMHVSPFFSLAGSYHFELPPPGRRLDAVVDLTRGGRTELAARLSLERQPLDDAHLLRALCRFPLVTLQVIAAIHWQALRLRARGARFWSQPPYDPEAARGEPS